MKIYKQRGDTIVEVLFAMAIIGLTLGIGYGIANRAIITGRDAQEQTEASKFAEAQLEKLILQSSRDPTYFSTTVGTPFCINPLVRVNDITLCRFGIDGRYTVSIVRTGGGLFTVTGTWDNTRGNYQSTTSLVYRTYNFSVAVAPPSPVVPTAPVPGFNITSATVNPGIDSGQFIGNVTGSPSYAAVTLTRVSNNVSRLITIPTPIPANISIPLGAIAPGEAYTFLFEIRDVAGNSLTTSTAPRLGFTTSTPTNMTAPTNNILLASPGPPAQRESKYYLSNNFATCSQATAEAVSKSGHLVTIGSNTENNFVAAFAAGVYIWLGYTDRVTEGSWRWVTGEPTTFIRWYAPTNEPNDYLDGNPGEDCAVMNWVGSGIWNDWYDRPASTARYVIEYEID